MRSIYICEQGAKVSVDGGRLTDSGLRLKNKPLKNYLKHYEKWLNRPIKNNPDR